MAMPVLGHPSLEESYPSLANWSGSGPSRVKESGQGQCPSQGDKLCPLSGLWSQGLWLSLNHGGLQLLKPGREVPNTKRYKILWEKVILQSWTGNDRVIPNASTSFHNYHYYCKNSMGDNSWVFQSPPNWIRQPLGKLRVKLLNQSNQNYLCRN